MQVFSIIVLGTLAIGIVAKNHHAHHENVVSTKYPEQKPNEWCLGHFEKGRLYHNLKYICHKNYQIINPKITAERSAIHNKIFNEIQLTPEDVENVCMHSDNQEKLSATETYDFMNDDYIAVICDNNKYMNLMDQLVELAYDFPSEIMAGIIPEGEMNNKIRREHIRNNIYNNPAVATNLLERYNDFKSVPALIQSSFKH